MPVLRRALDVLRIEIAAAHEDKILETAGDNEFALVQCAEIASAKEQLRAAREPRAKHLGGLCLAAPIARGHAAAGDPDFAHRIGGAFHAGLGVHNPHGERVRRHTHRHKAPSIF